MQQNNLIKTEFVYPPVPDRRYDWMAYIDGQEEGPTGRGYKEFDALLDLCDQLALFWIESDVRSPCLDNK